MNKNDTRQAYKNLDSDISVLITDTLENISKLIIDSPLANEDKIINLIYSFLETVYSTIINSLSEIYSQLADFNVDDILDLTYQEDGKTIEDRVHEYLLNHIDLISTLYKFYLLLDTESKNIKRAIIDNRVRPVASILIIECDEEDCHFGCDQYAGEYPADEPIELPPYHPNCDCFYYFVETDDPDDIKDLDLEIDEP